MVPFVGKPFHVDEPLFVWTAKQIAAHPFDPWGFTVNWTGHPKPMSEEMENPPGVPYLLAPVGRVAGWGETGMHAALLPFGILTVVGTALLAGRFCRYPVAAALLLVVAPGFWVSATSVMADGPLLCLWVWAVYLWTRGSAALTERGALITLAATAVVLILAVLVKYPAINLVPLLAAHAVLCPAPRRSTRLAQAVALAAPVLALVVYDRLSAARYGHGLVGHAILFSRSTTQQNPAPLAARLVDALCFLAGTALPAALVGIAVVCRRSWGRRAACVVAPVLIAIVVAHLFAPPAGWRHAGGPPAWGYYAQFGLLATIGAAAAIASIIGAGRDRAGLFLLLWVGGVLTFATFLNWSINVRTMLPMLPAACILTVRAVERLDMRLLRTVATAVILGGAISLAITCAEYRYARDNRDGAAQLAAAWWAYGVPASRVWFGGHWGFQYYMQLAGARPLDDRAHGYRDGDTIVLALDNYGTPAVEGRLERESFLSVGSPSWLTTTNLSMGGGFHVSAGDRLPLVVGPMPPEAYSVNTVHR